MKLHLFFPENDLALARDLAHYTPPPAAVKLRRSGATLPMWYGDSGDRFVAEGVNAAWYRQVERDFGTGILPYNHQPAGLEAAPWGWSKAARQRFIDLGFSSDTLPTDVNLDTLRALSHRRTAAKVAQILEDTLDFKVAPVAREITEASALKPLVKASPSGLVVKLPWSSSGRGLVATDTSIFDSQIGNFQGMIGRQGSVMAEVRHKGVLDFAMLFTLTEGKCRYDGLSLFHNTQLGSYAGNILAPQAELERRITAHCGQAQFDAIRTTLSTAIEAVAGDNYSGPLGVDMMIVDHPDYCIAPVVEINFRMTMGHLCRRFYELHATDGAEGSFLISPSSGAHRYAPVVENGRMSAGTLDLAAPGADFSFIINLS